MDTILFILPPHIAHDRFVNPGFNERTRVTAAGHTLGRPVTDMPLGPISLSAYLKHHCRVETAVVDFNVMLNRQDTFDHESFVPFYREILEPWRQNPPTIIGISALFTTSYFNMLDVAGVARELFPDALIIAGGGVPTNLYRRIFADSDAFDALCYGEGEKPLLELVQAEDRRALLASSRSWITPATANGLTKPEHDYIWDLDEIPFYDYSILDLEGYGLSPTLTNVSSFGVSGQLYHYATSRGCPYKCNFCASHSVHGRKMRYHSIGRVREDFARLRADFGAGIIGFQDDHLTADKNRMFEIIDVANDVGVKLYFQNGLTLYSLTRPMLEAMKGAGVTELVLPIESGSDRVLKEIMHKPLKLHIAKRVVDDCRDLGIDTYINILIGLPGETKEDIENTRAFLKTLDVTWFRVVVATPLVGSEMLETCLENDYISGDYIGCDFKNAVVHTEEFTPEFIEQKAYLLNLELNFVCNSDMRLGNFEQALEGFENTMRVSADHALAHYYAAQCAQALGLREKHRRYLDAYFDIAERSEFWQRYIVEFGLPLSPSARPAPERVVASGELRVE